MSNPTRAYLLIEDRLGKNLRQHIEQSRHRGDSWHRIARDLHEQTRVDVTSETVRMWFPELKPGLRKTDAA